MLLGVSVKEADLKYNKISRSCIYYFKILPKFNQGLKHSFSYILMKKLCQNFCQILLCKGFHQHINHCGMLISQWIDCRAAAFLQPATSIASRFQWGREIKVQIQLFFRVADFWVFCLIYITLIKVSKEQQLAAAAKEAVMCSQNCAGSPAITTNWVSMLVEA